MISEETIAAALKYQQERFYSDPVGMIREVVSALEEQMHEHMGRLRSEMFRMGIEIKKLREERK
jgi:hypothetical protein